MKWTKGVPTDVGEYLVMIEAVEGKFALRPERVSLKQYLIETAAVGACYQWQGDALVETIAPYGYGECNGGCYEVYNIVAYIKMEDVMAAYREA